MKICGVMKIYDPDFHSSDARIRVSKEDNIASIDKR
jgi:hypothetical protein